MHCLSEWITVSDHPIVAVMTEDARVASGLADDMLKRGIYVVGFSYPVRKVAIVETSIVAKISFCLGGSSWTSTYSCSVISCAYWRTSGLSSRCVHWVRNSSRNVTVIIRCIYINLMNVASLSCSFITVFKLRLSAFPRLYVLLVILFVRCNIWLT